jgi:hypothetical protein
MNAAIYARKSTDQSLPDAEKSVTRQVEHATEQAVQVAMEAARKTLAGSSARRAAIDRELRTLAGRVGRLTEAVAAGTGATAPLLEKLAAEEARRAPSCASMLRSMRPRRRSTSPARRFSGRSGSERMTFGAPYSRTARKRPRSSACSCRGLTAHPSGVGEGEASPPGGADSPLVCHKVGRSLASARPARQGQRRPTTRPGRAPVCRPPATTGSPFTRTHGIPAG